MWRSVSVLLVSEHCNTRRRLAAYVAKAEKLNIEIFDRCKIGFLNICTFQLETCVKFAMTLSDWSLFVLLWLIISIVAMQIVVERPPAYVMHCNANKHVTDVHWNRSSCSAAQMCIKPMQAHLSVCKHFGS